MPLERDEKARLMEELKHFIRGEIAKLSPPASEQVKRLEKAKKETATKG